MTTVTGHIDLELPRNSWAAHPNYPRQVLLLGAHDGFRQISRTLCTKADDGGDIDRIGWVFGYWKSAMSGHEHYEEGKLYPFLEARWGISCDSLRAGHDGLAVLDTRVRSAVESDDRAGLREALRDHDRALNTHLDEEELLVIPALLALEPAEFDRYYDGNIETLLADLAGKR